MAAPTRASAVDLHRHLEGCVRPATAVEFLEQLRPGFVPRYLDAISRLESGPQHPSLFFDVFDYLRMIYDHPAADMRVAREAVQDAAQEGLEYVEFRLNPLHFAGTRALPLEEVCERVCRSALEEANAHSIRVEFICTLTRHRPKRDLRVLAALARSEAASWFCGVDVAGVESARPLSAMMRYVDPWIARLNNFTAHSCESQPVAEVCDAFRWGASRIGHGIHIMAIPRAVETARARGVVFEVAPIANERIRDWTGTDAHPVGNMLAGGLQVALCTDDPCIFHTSVRQQYDYLAARKVLTRSQLEAVDRAGVASDAAFSRASERRTRFDGHRVDGQTPLTPVTDDRPRRPIER